MFSLFYKTRFKQIFSIMAWMLWQVSFASASTLVMHESPSGHSKVIGYLKAHTTINVVDSGWLYVFNTKTLKAGWVERVALQRFLAQHPGSRMVKQVVHVNPDGIHALRVTHLGQPNDVAVGQLLQQERLLQKKWLQDMTQTMRQLEHMTHTWFGDVS